MRPLHILLIALFVVFVLALTFAPRLLRQWRAAEDAPTTVMEPAPPATVPAEEVGAATAAPTMNPEAELERVTGMLMLHNACANRFDGFDQQARPTLEAWKRHHADTFARRGAEPDFHIVLAEPEASGDADGAPAHTEERALCERNLDAMRADIGEDSAR